MLISLFSSFSFFFIFLRLQRFINFTVENLNFLLLNYSKIHIFFHFKIRI